MSCSIDELLQNAVSCHQKNLTASPQWNQNCMTVFHQNNNEGIYIHLYSKFSIFYHLTGSRTRVTIVPFLQDFAFTMTFAFYSLPRCCPFGPSALFFKNQNRLILGSNLFFHSFTFFIAVFLHFDLFGTIFNTSGHDPSHDPISCYSLRTPFFSDVHNTSYIM